MQAKKVAPVRVRVQVTEHQGSRHSNIGSLMFYEITGDEMYERIRRWALETIGNFSVRNKVGPVRRKTA